MTSDARFVGNEWTCECGNQCHTSGFQPCLRDGTLVEPTPAQWTDGLLYRCLQCDAIIVDDPGVGLAHVMGRAERNT